MEPSKAETRKTLEISNEQNFNPDKKWQKGSYALRKLYHESKIPLLVIYTSSNCGPCHILKPQIKRVLEELKGKAQAVEIDIEIDQEISKQAGVNGTPTIQIFLFKELKKELKGVKQRTELKEEINKLISS